MLKKVGVKGMAGSVVLAGLFALLTFQVQAAQSLSDFPQARIMFESSISTDDYRLTLGALKKANNQWLAEREQRLSGELTRKTLELDSGFSAEEVFGFYREQLVNQGARELFYCHARDCGSSNSWANNRFGIKQLYGLDQHQWYAAFELMRDDKGPVYVALYSVTRGNRRSYTQVDQIAVTEAGVVAANPKTIIESIIAGKAYRIPGLKVNANGVVIPEAQLQSLVDALRQRPRTKVHLVGHDYDAASFEQQQQDSLSYAQAVKDQLVAQGIKAERLTVHGVGGLAPSSKRVGIKRVEVVLAR